MNTLLLLLVILVVLAAFGHNVGDNLVPPQVRLVVNTVIYICLVIVVLKLFFQLVGPL